MSRVSSGRLDRRDFLFGSGALALGAACSSGSASSVATHDRIRLARNPWIGSRVNVAIASILLTEKMRIGVDILDVDENAQWAALASGDLDACLEVWPSGHRADIADYVARGRVENGGTLGPIGRIGWYVPTYLLARYPALETWDGLANPLLIAELRTPETGTSGRFLAGDPSWTQYDRDIVKNLHLDLQIVFSGSEAATLQELDAAYQRRAAILFYLWTPHAAFARYDLTEVALPPYSDACYAMAAPGGIACEYPTDFLFKAFWPGLRQTNPRAYALLSRFTYSTKDQINLAGDVYFEHKHTEDVARAWVDANEGVWRAWIGG